MSKLYPHIYISTVLINIIETFLKQKREEGPLVIGVYYYKLFTNIVNNALNTTVPIMILT
jgi:hypothetical protein